MTPASSPTRDDEKLPEEIYVSLVASLFSDPRTLVMGAVGTVGAGLITAVKTGDTVFWLCALALAGVTMARALDMRAFKRRDVSRFDAAAAHRWELRYIVGSSLYVLVMGIWCFLAFARTSDPVVQLLSFSLVLVNIVGVAGRNFGSKLLVTTQLCCASIPLLLGLLYQGDIYYALAACVLAPFPKSFSTIADRLRSTLRGAVVAAQEVRLLADRLDAALNNMGHGLCMIDRKGNIAVANQRLNQLLGLPKDVFKAGRTASDALQTCARAGVIERSRLRSCLAELLAQIASGDPASILVPLRDERILMITSRRMLDGSSVVLVEDVTVQKHAEARISRLAHFDSLTELPNRVSFRNTVTRLLNGPGRESGCALLFVDLDEFKQVNDTLGHPSGDELLKQVAARLQAIVSEGQLIARLGGDEFVILLAPLADPAEAAAVAHRVVQELSVPYQVDGHLIIIGASVGISVAPVDATDADTLLKNADLALYRAKAEGRGRYRFFEVEMDHRMREKRALETDLRNALQRREFAVHYQPMVNLKTGRIAGCEALVRWFHPERGLVPPVEFIPMAEEMGLVVEIGAWVLRTACLEAMHWPTKTRISVNLSPAQFRHGGLVQTVDEALRSTGLAPSRLILEITESTLLRDTESVLNTLNEIRRLGVSIALDDFGTGYSSLSYLRKFPLQAVKIDRSFLAGIETNRKQKILLRGIARLCGELGVKVVIEGVETSEQLEVIASNPEIEFAQGYMFAKPASAAHIRGLMDFGFQTGAGSPSAKQEGPARVAS